MLFMSCKEAFEWKMNDDWHPWFSGNVASFPFIKEGQRRLAI